jgi:hypothetical protein
MNVSKIVFTSDLDLFSFNVFCLQRSNMFSYSTIYHHLFKINPILCSCTTFKVHICILCLFYYLLCEFWKLHIEKHNTKLATTTVWYWITSVKKAKKQNQKHYCRIKGESNPQTSTKLVAILMTRLQLGMHWLHLLYLPLIVQILEH